MNRVKINYTYQYLSNIWNKTEKRYKLTFFGAILAGLLAHVYQFTNKLFNYDELHATPSALGEGFGYGRWMQEIIYRFIRHFWGNYSLPVINGIISLIIFSIGACIIVYVLEINNEAYACIIGGLCTTFPVVTCSFFYMYMSYYFALAMLFSVLSVVVVIKSKNVISYLCGIFLLSCSIGIYQSYFSVAVSLIISYLVIYCVRDCYNYKNDIKVHIISYMKIVTKYLFFLILALILYLEINNIVLYFFQEKMVDYQGIKEMESLNFTYILAGFIRAYKSFIKLFFFDVFQVNPTTIVRIGFFSLIAIALTELLMLLFEKEHTYCVIFSIFFLSFFPASVFLIFLITNENTYHYTLMMYSLVFVLVLPLAIIDKCSNLFLIDAINKKTWLIKISDYISCIIGALIIMNYIWFANGNYQALQYTNYHDVFYYSTMVTQIKSMDYYRDDMPIAMIGNEIVDESNLAGSLMIQDFNIKGKAESNINAWSFYEIIRGYIGFTQEFVWDDTTQEMLKNNEKVKEMPCYPKDGSIKMVDNIIVVKLSEY